MKLRVLRLALLALLLPAAALPAAARVSAEQAARLGAALTPVGAEAAASADGSIPAYGGGLSQRGQPSGEYPAEPEVTAEKPLYTVTAANLAQHAALLTRGHQELLRRFPSYRMNVYPSHRPVAFPQHIVAATRRNATEAELVGTDSVRGAVHGFPFPLPGNGAEVIWNHKMRWRGSFLRRYNNQMIVARDGSFQLSKLIEDIRFTYTSPTFDGRSEDLLFQYRSKTVYPPRSAGDTLLVHETSDQTRQMRLAWRYNPAIDRVNRAPDAAYDTAALGTDGNQFYDQIDVFNGALDRYDWKLVGKKEMLIAYDSYRTASPQLKYAEMARPLHFNQELARYEKHRVWVVEATLRAGTRHSFARRTFYVDEDSWAIAAVDCYDQQGGLYKFQEAHQIFARNMQAVGGVPELIYDFVSGRYFVTALSNEDKPNDWSVSYQPSDFEPNALRRGSR